MTSTIQVPTPARGAESPRAGGGPVQRRNPFARARPWLLLAPALAVLAVLLLWPLVRVVLFSLQDYGLREIVSGEPNWIGLDNYVEIFTDPDLWTVVLPNTVGFAVLAVALHGGPRHGRRRAAWPRSARSGAPSSAAPS